LSNEEFLAKLGKMKVPLHRVNTNKNSLEWLSKNLKKFNEDHKYYDLISKEVNRRLDLGEYEN
jgi:hypothetical protein